MALSPQLLNFKSSGVYRLEFDKSQTANINVETLRLVVGHSRKGPYNTPVLIDSQETFNNVFGSIDKGLEKKGMFFHRSCIESLTRGPILALNLAKFTPGTDKAYWQAPSTNGSLTGSNLSASDFGDYDKFFDNDKFMVPSDAATLAEINDTDDNNLINFVNIKQDSITVIVRQAASVKEFDLTAREWYGEGNVPEYLNEFDKMSDFMIDVFVFKGEFDAATMSNDPIYSKYFNADGLDKTLLNEFANLRQVSLIAQYTGSILPGFKDLEGRNLYIESTINAEARRTGLFCAVNEEAVLNDNGTKVDFVGHIVNEDQDYELLSHVVKQNAVLSNHPIDLNPTNTVAVNGNTLTVTNITSLEADKAINNEDSLLASTPGEYAVIVDSPWIQTAPAIPATQTTYNNVQGTSVALTGNAVPTLSPNGLTMTIPGANYTASITAGKYLFGGTGNANVLIAGVSFTGGSTIIVSNTAPFVIDSSLASNVINVYNGNGVIAAIPQGPDNYNQTVGQTLTLWGNVSQYLTNNNETLVIPGGDFTSLFTTNDYLYGGLGNLNVKIDSISYTGGTAGDTLINAASGEQFDIFVETVIEKFADNGFVQGAPAQYNTEAGNPVQFYGDAIISVGTAFGASAVFINGPTNYSGYFGTNDWLFGGVGQLNVKIDNVMFDSSNQQTILLAGAGFTFDPSIANSSTIDVFSGDGFIQGAAAQYNTEAGTDVPLRVTADVEVADMAGTSVVRIWSQINYSSLFTTNDYLYGGPGLPNIQIANVVFNALNNETLIYASGGQTFDSSIANFVGEITLFTTDGFIPGTGYNQETGTLINNLEAFAMVNFNIQNFATQIEITSHSTDYSTIFTQGSYLYGGLGVQNAEIATSVYNPGNQTTTITLVGGQSFDTTGFDSNTYTMKTYSTTGYTPAGAGTYNDPSDFVTTVNNLTSFAPVTFNNPVLATEIYVNSSTDYSSNFPTGSYVFGGTGVQNSEVAGATYDSVTEITTITLVAGQTFATAGFDQINNYFYKFLTPGYIAPGADLYNQTQETVVGPLQGWIAPIVSNNGYTLTFNGLDISGALNGANYLYAGNNNPNAEILGASNFGAYSTITLDPAGDPYTVDPTLEFYELNTYVDNGVTPGTPAVPAQYNTASPSSTLTLTNGGAAVLSAGNTVLTIPGAGIYTVGIQSGDYLFGGTGVANTVIDTIQSTSTGVTIITAAVGSTFSPSLNGATTLTLFNADGVIQGTPAVPAKGTLTLTCDVNINASVYTALSGTNNDLNFWHVSNSRTISNTFPGLLGTAGAYSVNGTTFTVNYGTSVNTPATFPIAIGDYVQSATANRIAKVIRVSKSGNAYTVYCDVAPEATWSGYYIKSFENASDRYKTFVLPKAEITVKNIQDYLSVLSGGVGLYEALVDKDMIDFRYIVDTFTSFDGTLRNKRNLSQLAKDRQNASAILNAPTIEDFKKSTDPSFTDSEGQFDTAYIATSGNQDKNPTGTYTLPSIAEGANYAFYYGPGLIVSDNGKDIIVPPAAYVANNYMDKYTNALPWSIVAGPRRGVVSGTNVKGTEYSFDKNDRDILEPFGINPIVFQRGTGLTILGNKTAQQSIKSALSSAHVREALIYIQDGIADILKDYVFEFNNVQTRLEIKTLADSFLESVKQDGGVYEFKNVMDQSNNTNEVIDNNMGIIDTYVEPVKGLEIVVHRTTILNTGEIQSGNLG